MLARWKIASKIDILSGDDLSRKLLLRGLQFEIVLEAKWKAVVAAIQRLHLSGRPILIGTRSVAASEHLAGLIQAAGLPYQLLNARQDKDEAEIVARAGEPGRITVATNMAGRGTDIKLAPGVAERGGLHVIATELNDSTRIDRQLYGRGARQGDKGSCQAILAVEDDPVKTYLPWACAWLAGHEQVHYGWRGSRSRWHSIVPGALTPAHVKSCSK